MKIVKLANVQKQSIVGNVYDLRRGLPKDATLSIEDADCYHPGFFNYLAKAWSKHYGIVIKPDDIWYTILAELTSLISKTPKKFEYLFTKTPDNKQLILVPTNDVTSIDPELIIAELRGLVPVYVDSFIPRFSTTTPESKLAMHVAFCDMISPYYNYGTFLCGYPYAKILGTAEDWGLLVINLIELKRILAPTITDYPDYFDRCIMVAQRIWKADKADLLTMVTIEPCGSGSQYELGGWINGLLVDHPEQTQLEGLPSHISKMHYKNMETERTFTMFVGLMHSFVEDEFLVPSYSTAKIETTPKENSVLV